MYLYVLPAVIYVSQPAQTNVCAYKRGVDTPAGLYRPVGCLRRRRVRPIPTGMTPVESLNSGKAKGLPLNSGKAKGGTPPPEQSKASQDRYCISFNPISFDFAAYGSPGCANVCCGPVMSSPWEAWRGPIRTGTTPRPSHFTSTCGGGILGAMFSPSENFTGHFFPGENIACSTEAPHRA